MSKISIFLLATAALARAVVVPRDAEPSKLTAQALPNKRFVDLPEEMHWSEVAELAATNNSFEGTSAMHDDPHNTLVKRSTGEVGSTTSLVEIGFEQKGKGNMILLCDDPKWETCTLMKPPKNKCLNISPKHDNQISSATAFKGISCYLYDDPNCSKAGLWLWFNIAYPAIDLAKHNFDNKASSFYCVDTGHGDDPNVPTDKPGMVAPNNEPHS